METAILQEPLGCKRGETYDETFEFTDENNAPIDITAKTPSLALRESTQQKDPPAAVATCSIVAPNKCRVVISATDTAKLKVRTYKTDLKFTEGAVIDYPFEGDFIVEEAITRS